MKCTILVSTFVVFFVLHETAAATPPFVKRFEKECLEELGYPVEDRINRRPIDKDTERKYIACVSTRSGLISDEGVVDRELVLRHTPEDRKSRVTAVLDACRDIVGDDTVTRVWNFHKCFLENSEKVHL